MTATARASDFSPGFHPSFVIVCLIDDFPRVSSWRASIIVCLCLRDGFPCVRSVGGPLPIVSRGYENRKHGKSTSSTWSKRQVGPWRYDPGRRPCQSLPDAILAVASRCVATPVCDRGSAPVHWSMLPAFEFVDKVHAQRKENRWSYTLFIMVFSGLIVKMHKQSHR